jgi:hypothetical protein
MALHIFKPHIFNCISWITSCPYTLQFNVWLYSGFRVSAQTGVSPLEWRPSHSALPYFIHSTDQWREDTLLTRYSTTERHGYCCLCHYPSDPWPLQGTLEPYPQIDLSHHYLAVSDYWLLRTIYLAFKEEVKLMLTKCFICIEDRRKKSRWLAQSEKRECHS